jgi:hypothetical protein
MSAAIAAEDVTVTVQERSQHPHFSIGIGSRLELQLPNEQILVPAIFLGRMVDQERRKTEYLFLDEKQTKILMIDPVNVQGLRSSNSQPVISPINQIGSTCAAYGIFHFWNQIYVTRLPALPILAETMMSDRRRMQLLEEVLDIYYIQNRTNISTLMKSLGKRFGLRCRNNPFSDGKNAADFLYRSARAGVPILLDFNVGRDMVRSTYEVTDYETLVTRDPRMWVPRQVGQRNSSGHVIVVAAAFMGKGRRKLLVLDSNWTEPRVWDLELHIARGAAVREMGFHTCEGLSDPLVRPSSTQEMPRGL